MAATDADEDDCGDCSIFKIMAPVPAPVPPLGAGWSFATLTPTVVLAPTSPNAAAYDDGTVGLATGTGAGVSFAFIFWDATASFESADENAAGAASLLVLLFVSVIPFAILITRVTAFSSSSRSISSRNHSPIMIGAPSVE